MIRIDFENPPDWLYDNDYRSVAIRRTISGSSLLKICNKCGTILATSERGIPEHLDECPNPDCGEDDA